MFFNWEHFFQIGGNGAKVLVEFENVFWIGGIFFTIGGIFFKLGAMGANVLVEFEKKILTGGIFKKNWGQLSKCVSGIWKKILTGVIFF